MTRIPMRGTGICACLAILSGVIAGELAWVPPATAAGSPDAEQKLELERRVEVDTKGQPPPPAYDRGMKLVEQGKFRKAREAFELARRLAPTHPDVLNMLAYSQRQTGALDAAIENYRSALRGRPNFPQAREYLGEAYLQAALRELIALERAGTAARREHAMLLRALHEAAAELPPAPDASVEREGGDGGDEGR